MKVYLISVSPAVEGDDLLLADAGLADGADLAVGPRLKPLQGGNSIEYSHLINVVCYKNSQGFL